MKPVKNETSDNKRRTTHVLLNNIAVSDIIAISNITTDVDDVTGFYTTIYYKILRRRM